MGLSGSADWEIGQGEVDQPGAGGEGEFNDGGGHQFWEICRLRALLQERNADLAQRSFRRLNGRRQARLPIFLQDPIRPWDDFLGDFPGKNWYDGSQQVALAP